MIVQLALQIIKYYSIQLAVYHHVLISILPKIKFAILATNLGYFANNKVFNSSKCMESGIDDCTECNADY